MPRHAATITIAALLSVAPASAQAPAPQPAETHDSVVAKARRFIEAQRIAERLSPRDGVYPRIGGLTTGSGMAGGAGYRRHLFEDRLFADASAVISVKHYTTIDLQARWLRAWHDRVELWTNYRYQNYPQEDFFGIGPGAASGARANYAVVSHDITTRGLVQLRPWLRVGADLGYDSPAVGHGADAEWPSIEHRFTDVQAPGLGDQPDFVHHSLFAAADTRDRRGRPSRGGVYRASLSTWDDTTLQQFDFHRFDGDAAHFIPIAGAAHIVALHAGASHVVSAGGDRVPFYFLPYIGGSDTVRGLLEFRYRDEHLAFLNAEYRWGVHTYVDVVAFFDAGKVGHTWREITFQTMKTAYGVGARLHSDARVFFRVDVGTGSGEGTNVFVKFGPSF